MTEPLAAQHLEQLLEVTRALSAPLQLSELLGVVADAACAVLQAERCSVWLHDAARAELVLKLASDLADVRLPVGTGFVGLCARERRLVNVPDCYADPRFDRGMDLRTGFHTRCSLTLPLLDPDGTLVGVMQLLNRAGGQFSAADERLAQALAAQCAVALQRASLLDALISAERARQELAVARAVQQSTLPTAMPQLAGWACHGLALPAAETGGDTFDLAALPGGLLVVLADATGHGIGPALSVTQMHAMLRMALRLGAPLPQAFLQLNNLLAETLADDRFITAFIGVLDSSTASLHYFSAGQGPILQRHAEGRWSEHRPTGFPLGALPMAAAREPASLVFQPGELLVLLSDGIYEQEDAAGERFGAARVRAVVDAWLAAEARSPGRGLDGLSQALLGAVQAHAGAAAQDDDITLVLLRREPEVWRAVFERDNRCLDALFAFSARCCAEAGVADGTRRRLDFVLEELVTNVIKYGGGVAEVPVTLRCSGRQLVGVVEDPDGRPFDPADAPEVDVSLPVAQRRAGGLGLHLIKRLVQSLDHWPAADGHGPRLVFVLDAAAPDAAPGPQPSTDHGTPHA
jgi:phosphoserine phosphatase RsbU/P